MLPSQCQCRADFDLFSTRKTVVFLDSDGRLRQFPQILPFVLMCCHVCRSYLFVAHIPLKQLWAPYAKLRQCWVSRRRLRHSTCRLSGKQARFRVWWSWEDAKTTCTSCFIKKRQFCSSPSQKVYWFLSSSFFFVYVWTILCVCLTSV